MYAYIHTCMHACMHVCMHLCMVVYFPRDNFKTIEASVTNVDKHDNLEACWCGNNFSIEKIKSAGPRVR